MASQIQELYKQYDKTDKSLTFTEFVKQQTQKDPSEIVTERVDTSSYVGGLEGRPMGEREATIGQKIIQTIPQEPRKIAANFYDNLAGGTANLAADVAGFLNPTNLKLPDKFKKDTSAAYQESLGATFGYDLIDVTQDETGEYYYDLEKPKTTVGNLTSDIGSFFAAMRTGKNPIKSLTTPKPKRGRPPKQDSPAYFKRLKKERRIGTAQNIAAAELAGQIVIDPEEGRIAYDLGKWAGKNDIAVLDAVFEYLDLEDPAELSAMENRLGLLVESLAAGGIIVGGVRAFIETLKGIKSGGTAVVNQFKKTANAGRENTKSFQVKEELKPNKVAEPVTLPSFIENSRFRPVAQKTLDIAENLRKRTFTSKGVMSEKMFSIINQADNAKVAIAEESLDTVARIENGLRTAAKEIAINPLSSKNRQAYEELNNKFRNYLTGTLQLKDLPKNLRSIAKDVKADVTLLSKQMLGNSYVPDELRGTIKKELGKYLRQTYEIFENPQWSPSRAVRLDAVNYIAKSLRRTKGYREGADGATDADRYAEATKRVDELLKASKGQTAGGIDDSVRTHLNQMFGSKQAEKLFANRKNIAPEIRALLGETTAGSTSVFRTLTTVSNYLTDTKMYDDLLAAGQGKYFFDDGIKRAGLVEIKGQQFHALNGKFTTPEIAKMFNKQAEAKNVYLQAYDKLLVLKGFGQASATVLNNITHIRNTIGQSLIMAENGLNPFGKETADSFKVLANNFKAADNRDQAVRDLYLKYQRLGIVNQNVKVGEFKRIINEAALGQDRITGMIGNSLTKRGVDTITQTAKKAYKKAEQLYVAEDDLFRIAAYEKELLTLREANTLLTNKLTTEQLERKAAEIIRDTMPTYDLIPEGAKALRRMPFGNFFAFAAERFRNTYHTINRSREEILSGNKVLEERGIQRLASKVAVGFGGSTATVEASKLLFGVTDEVHKAYKDLLLPEWSQNSAIGYYRNDQGELLYYDLSYTDPNAPVLDVVRASLNEFTRTDQPIRSTQKMLFDATAQGMKKFFEPYVSEALLTQATLDVIFGDGKTETGSRIPGWNEADPTDIDNLVAAFRHVGNSLIPAAYKNLAPEAIGGKKGSLGELIYRDLTNKPEYRRFDGSKKDMDLDLLANTTGLRLYKIDDKALDTALTFKIKDFQNKRRIYRGDIADATTYQNNYDDVLAQYLEINTNYYKAQREFYKSVKAARILNVNIIDKLDDLPFTSRRERNALIEPSPYFTPLRFSDKQRLDILDKTRPTDNIKYWNQFTTQLFKLEEQLSGLPLVDIPIDSRKKGYAEELPRLQKFTGGLIDPKFPVTDVAKNPASRDIANQLSSFEDIANNINPYRQDMERLGFNKGKEAAIEDWYALQQKNKRLNSERNANQYVKAQIDRLANTLGVEYSDEAFKNLKTMQRIFSTAESDNRQTTQNKYEQYEGASRDALQNLLANADKNKIDKEWLQSIDPTKPETWDDGQADTMMLGYILSQKGTDEQVSQILQGNFGTNKKGPVRNLYENNWVRAKFGGEYESINPDSDPESNFKRAMDLNL